MALFLVGFALGLLVAFLASAFAAWDFAGVRMPGSCQVRDIGSP